jgi:hypothetical protein
MKLPASVTRTFGRQLLIARKHAPSIFFGLGVGSVIGGTIMACRATMKAGPLVDEFHHDIKNVHELKERYDEEHETSYDEQQYTKDVLYVYAKGTWRFVKLYAPAAALSVAGIAMLSGSHGMLMRRNAALTSTLALATKALDDYRNRVRKEIGHDREKELYVGEMIDVVEMREDGDMHIVGEVIDTNTLSLYSKVFCETNENWENDNELHRNFIQCQQNFADAQLHARGHVFLNEVYEMLGFPHTKAGAIVGWVLRGPNSDNFVEFGLFERRNYDAVNGYENAIVLDFNVDGVILDLI